MRTSVLAAALAAGLGLANAQASDRVAAAGDTPPASPPVASIAKDSVPEVPATAANPAVAPAAMPELAVAEKPKPPAPPSLIVKINLATQRMDVIANGKPIHTWPISSGRAGFETPRGSFRAQWAAKMWYSRKYDLAPMPHAVFINGGVAIHATSSVGMLGQPASHGCIRLAPGNAATFYGLAHKHGLRQTQVTVFGTPPSSRIADRRQRSRDLGPQRMAGGQMPGTPGLVQLRPGSPHYGAPSFEHNGIRYVRVR